MVLDQVYHRVSAVERQMIFFDRLEAMVEAADQHGVDSDAYKMARIRVYRLCALRPWKPSPLSYVEAF